MAAYLPAPLVGHDAEVGVLGCMLIEPEAAPQVQAILGPADFHRAANRAIYEAMLDLYMRSEPIDFITLSEELRKTGRLDAVGGITYLTSLGASVPTAAHVETYAQLVHEAAASRRAATAAAMAHRALGVGDLDAARDALAQAEREVAAAQGQQVVLPPSITADTFLAHPAPPIDWVLPGVLPTREVALLEGGDGTSKSFLGIELGISVACGIEWAGGLLPAPAVTGRVVAISGEDDGEELHRRVEAISAAYDVRCKGHGWARGMSQLEFVPLDGVPMPLMTADRRGYTPRETAWVAALAQRIAGSRLVILDPMIMLHELPEIDSLMMDRVIRLMIRLVRAVGHCSAVIVHHAGQDAVRSGQDDHMTGRGSTGINGPVRAVVTVRKPTAVEAVALAAAGQNPSRWRSVRGPKISRGDEREPMWLVVDDHGVPMVATPPVTLAQASQVRSRGRRGQLAVVGGATRSRRREPGDDDDSIWGGSQS